MGELRCGSRTSSRRLCSRVGASTLGGQGLGRLQWAHCTGLQVCSICRQSPGQPGRIIPPSVGVSTSCWVCTGTQGLRHVASGCC